MNIQADDNSVGTGKLERARLILVLFLFSAILFLILDTAGREITRFSNYIFFQSPLFCEHQQIFFWVDEILNASEITTKGGVRSANCTLTVTKKI